MSTFCQRVTVRIGVVFTVVVLSVAGSLLTRTAARASRQTDVNARDAHGMTPLDYAVEQNDIASIRALVQLGADPNAPDMSGRTLLAWSSFGGGLEVVRAMIEAGADVNMKDRIRDVCREIDI